MRNEMLRSCNRRSATTAILLFGPMRRRRSKIQGYSRESCGGRAVHRKNKFKPGAATVGIFSRDRAAVRFNDGSYDGQSHSESFGFRTEERIEETVPHLLGNADTIIAHARANHAIAV